jgi:oligoribonuclease (3'-5' exoribonuclease)
MLNRETPEIVAMVTMGGKQFHYKDPAEIAEIVWDADTAPARWDNYVYPANTASEKPKSLKSLTQAQWDEFRGLATPKPKVQQMQGWVMGEHGRYGYTPHTQSSWKPSEDKKPVKTAVDYINKYMGTVSRPLNESKTFNRRRKRYNQPMWGMDGSFQDYKTNEDFQIDLALDEAETASIITEEDYESATLSQMESIEYWRLLFASKAEAIADIFDTLGMTMTYNIKPKETAKPVEGQTALTDILEF